LGVKTALITGISKGIGLALAQKFLAEGFEVLGTVHTGRFPEKNDRLTVFSLDLSSSESLVECSKKIVSTGKTIDILISNAGVLFDEDETTVVVEKLRKTLEVNLIGTIDFTERTLSLMNSGGHIVNISSTAGSLERTGHAESHFPYHYPAYKISKAALNMYTRTLALRLKNRRIVVSSVHPGWVKTDMGGAGAEITPKEAAEKIYTIAASRPQTGSFWFGDEKLPW